MGRLSCPERSSYLDLGSASVADRTDDDQHPCSIPWTVPFPLLTDAFDVTVCANKKNVGVVCAYTSSCTAYMLGSAGASEAVRVD